MPNRRVVGALCSVALALSLPAPSASGDLAPWDRARVTQIAKDLARATDELEVAFTQQPPPSQGSGQRVPYYQLKNRVRMLRNEARVLVTSLEQGSGREQTAWMYEILISHARSARYEAPRVFLAKDVGERAAAVRQVLNQLGPYYDPDFAALAPHPSIEPSAPR
jgi:hypothetical protein